MIISRRGIFFVVVVACLVIFTVNFCINHDCASLSFFIPHMVIVALFSKSIFLDSIIEKKKIEKEPELPTKFFFISEHFEYIWTNTARKISAPISLLNHLHPQKRQRRVFSLFYSNKGRVHLGIPLWGLSKFWGQISSFIPVP